MFPHVDGFMHGDDLPLQDVLSRTLGHASIVTGYTNKRRSSGL